MGKLKAEVEVRIPPSFSVELLRLVNVAIDDAAMEIAVAIKASAKASTAFRDYKNTERENVYSKKHHKSGTMLRQSIKHKKSKFPDGGAIVYSAAPHAHLVEFGHALVEGRKFLPTYGQVIGHVKAHSYLRSSREEVMGQAAEAFAKSIGNKLRGA
ncbi:HK97 gp10 family phage protein [Megalodesulfovibrio gigas]|uniref:Phage protein, HK97 gp10 family n=1 Tax=Megalodesulfovibrio gigas (strain ATCC 19364 / DSM 1382 / NCIMB 9332 / VKM B-1759) TaxID=1121448 RepID=T2GD20_MEGG1|nr:hypothetical protein [Megalodesulfovibrio gigas]AGW13812.1 putative conseeved hypothetical protein [Megalodesulfovibrio gigas DSM 1382 = ATCC 19364]